MSDENAISRAIDNGFRRYQNERQRVGGDPKLALAEVMDGGLVDHDGKKLVVLTGWDYKLVAAYRVFDDGLLDADPSECDWLRELLAPARAAAKRDWLRGKR